MRKTFAFLSVLLGLSGLALAGCADDGATAKAGLDDSVLASDVDDAVAEGEISADSPRAPTMMGAIAAGETKMGSFSSRAKYLAWTFTARADDKLTLRATGAGGEVDTVLFVYRASATTGRPSGTELAMNDDDGNDVSSRVELTAPRTGSYVAIVRRYDLGTTGAVRLSLTSTAAPEMPPPPPATGGLRALGNGTHALASLTATTIATERDGLADPRDLAFNPNADHELWITNYATDAMVIVTRTGATTQTTRNVMGEGGQHFMARPAGLAFGDGMLATAHEIDVPTQPTTPDDFMGPTLWVANARTFNAGWASHMDMLHNSPNATGIAWDQGNVYWVFDGFHNAITRYDFQRDHGPGGEDHSDGIVARYVQGSVRYVRGVSSGMELDHRTHLLYIADTGNRRIAVLDTQSGTRGPDIDPNYDGGEQFAVRGARITTLVDGTLTATSLRQPSGLALRDGILYVTDRASAKIYGFRTDGTLVDWVDVSSAVEPGSLGAIELDREGRIYVTDVLGNKVVRFAPR